MRRRKLELDANIAVFVDSDAIYQSQSGFREPARTFIAYQLKEDTRDS